MNGSVKKRFKLDVYDTIKQTKFEKGKMNMPIFIGLKQKLPAVFLSLSTFASIFPFSNVSSAADMQPQYQFNSTVTGACAHQHVLSNLDYRFNHEMRNVPSLPLRRLKSLENIVMTHEDIAATKLNVTRQYCQATGVMSDGTKYPVWYMIEFGKGFVGMGGFNLEFCVQGFDKWLIQDGKCQAVRS